MKIIHTAMMKNFSSGIVQQMFDELNVAKEINENYLVKIFSPTQRVEEKYSSLFQFCSLNERNKLLAWIKFRQAYYSWLMAQSNNIDCFILRYSAYDPLQYFFVINCRKPVYFVHHSKEHDELKLIGGGGKIYYLVDRFFGNMSIKASKGIIGVTNELIDYERSRINNFKKLGILYPNGVEVSEEDIEDNRSNVVPEILFVASYFYSWHGLDLLLDEIEKCDKKFILHLVGDLLPDDLIRAQKDERIILHGRLTNLEIISLSSKCWVGLGSFALNRKNSMQGSTLKVREYLNNGLPVYSGHSDIFPCVFEFYKFDILNMDLIIKFSMEMRKYSKCEVRGGSAVYISKKMLLQKLIADIDLYQDR